MRGIIVNLLTRKSMHSRLSTRSTAPGGYVTQITFVLLSSYRLRWIRHRDERTVDDFCVPNLADAFHRAPPPSPSPSPQQQPQLRAALTSRTQICRGAVTSHPAFRFSRHALITAPGKKNEQQEKEREEKERKRGGGDLIRLHRTRIVTMCMPVCAYTRCVSVAHTTDAIAKKYVGCEMRFGECAVPPIASGATRVITIHHVCVYVQCVSRHTGHRIEEVSPRVLGEVPGSNSKVIGRRGTWRGPQRGPTVPKNVSVNTGELFNLTYNASVRMLSVCVCRLNLPHSRATYC